MEKETKRHWELASFFPLNALLYYRIVDNIALFWFTTSVIGIKDVFFISHPKSEEYYQGYKKLNQNLDRSLQ